MHALLGLMRVKRVCLSSVTECVARALPALEGITRLELVVESMTEYVPNVLHVLVLNLNLKLVLLPAIDGVQHAPRARLVSINCQHAQQLLIGFADLVPRAFQVRNT